jgi:hypothetical protein
MAIIKTNIQKVGENLRNPKVSSETRRESRGAYAAPSPSTLTHASREAARRVEQPYRFQMTLHLYLNVPQIAQLYDVPSHLSLVEGQILDNMQLHRLRQGSQRFSHN